MSLLCDRISSNFFCACSSFSTSLSNFACMLSILLIYSCFLSISFSMALACCTIFAKDRLFYYCFLSMSSFSFLLSSSCLSCRCIFSFNSLEILNSLIYSCYNCSPFFFVPSHLRYNSNVIFSLAYIYASCASRFFFNDSKYNCFSLFTLSNSYSSVLILAILFSSL